MITYTFTSHDSETGNVTTAIVKNEEPCWSGTSGPMFNFLLFLKGCGFEFNINSEIGIMTWSNQDGAEVFMSAHRFPGE